jgi:hypothetical protein
VMRQAGGGAHGDRLRGLIVVLWRAGLRIAEALDLHESDLEPGRGALLVREGKGGRRREVGMDQPSPWLDRRSAIAAGPLFCVIDGPTRGRPWTAPAVRIQLRRLAAAARRAAPLRAAPAPSRPRRRDGTRRCATQRDPTPARSREPPGHHHLPARHRQRRDHQCRPRPARADDARQRRLTRLSRSWCAGRNTPTIPGCVAIVATVCGMSPRSRTVLRAGLPGPGRAVQRFHDPAAPPAGPGDGRLLRRPLPAGAFAVLAPRPAAGPALAFLELLLGPANPALSGHLLLGIFDPANELVAGQGRDVLPRVECRGVGDQRLAQVCGQLVHHPTGHSLAAHRAARYRASRRRARFPSGCGTVHSMVGVSRTCESPRGPTRG